jgi:hypothetical protein
MENSLTNVAASLRSIAEAIDSSQNGEVGKIIEKCQKAAKNGKFSLIIGCTESEYKYLYANIYPKSANALYLGYNKYEESHTISKLRELGFTIDNPFADIGAVFSSEYKMTVRW